MDSQKIKSERRVGHVPSEMEQLGKAVTALVVELDGLETILTPVLRSQKTSSTCDAVEPEPESDCPLANEIASSRRAVQQLTRTIRELKDRLES